MQDNYVKLLLPQVCDLGVRGGRGSVLSSSETATSRRFSHHVRSPEPGVARRSPRGTREGLAQIANRVASLNEYVVQTAHALQLAAADTAALLEQRADLVGQPGQIDYPTEIKRWRAFADQAEQMAKRWEQRQ